jgi:flagellar assembly factor FliW
MVVINVKINTKFHGELEINPDHILQFEQGIPGFEEEKQFYIFPFKEGNEFFILQSVHTPALGFVMIDPFQFFKDYSVKISDAAKETLMIKESEDVVIFSLLTIREGIENTTVNLQGPIIINDRIKKGKQVILVDSDYKTNHPLFSKTPTEEKEGAK